MTDTDRLAAASRRSPMTSDGWSPARFALIEAGRGLIELVAADPERRNLDLTTKALDAMRNSR